MTDLEIRDILFDAFLGGTDTGDNTCPITKDDFHKLKYCKVIIKEVDRVLLVANMMVRCSQEPDELTDYKMASWYNVSYYWEEPEKFNPGRWMVKGFELEKYSFIIIYEIDLVDMQSSLKTVLTTITTCPELFIKVRPRN
ncbi:3467_t:CDS:2 [Funneliformis caledonium]|uniref:3467_t:CDS:1 n=1 Tax=Funneliformis caledonium TaxID=1117310 RepID=A0A9N9BWS6_9GLOM|nr:3467_t:CDS:2 [Funneliformis caledonium]